jgi:hypothetical protein
MDTEIDALAEASRNIQNKTGEQSLWKAVLNLPTWFFLAQGEGDDVEPMVGAFGPQKKLLAFTSEERAEAFAKHLAKKGGHQPGILEMDVPSAVEYCQQLFDAKVPYVLFNNGDYGFESGMIKIRDMAGRYRA